MWTCPKCGERIEDQFDSCWKCANQSNQIIALADAFHCWRRFFLYGVLFEVVLIALCFLLQRGWCAIEIHNLFFATHLPLLWFMGSFHLEGGLFSEIFCLLIGLFIMGSFWAFLIYCSLAACSWTLSRLNLSKRQKFVVSCSVGLLCLAALTWIFVTHRPEKPIPFTSSPQIKSAVDGNTIFALDLYQKLKSQPGNLFFSPYSISTIMAMAYMGAQGQTKAEIAKTLHFNLTSINLATAFSALITRMNRIQRWNRIQLVAANSFWGQRNYPFLNSFSNLIHTHFQAQIRQVDFRHSASVARSEINQWVERKTDGKIKALVGPRQFTDYTRLILCDAIYFKGKWLHPFKASRTKPSPFHVSTNQTVTVPMMYQEAKFKMAFSEDYTVELLEMPYSGKDLSMIILMPTSMPELSGVEHNDLSTLEKKLTPKNLHFWLTKLDQANPDKTWVGLPRFTVTQEFDVANELKSLGIISAFDNAANFSGMDGTTNLYISDVFHKAFVQVNEAGTEAIAATFATAKTKGMPMRFIADHPFIFLIRDNGSGAILFIGRMIDPTK